MDKEDEETNRKLQKMSIGRGSSKVNREISSKVSRRSSSRVKNSSNIRSGISSRANNSSQNSRGSLSKNQNASIPSVQPQYFTKDKFLQTLESCISAEDYEQFREVLKKQYSQLKQHNKQSAFIFPFIMESNLDLLRLKLTLFVREFAKQAKRDRKKQFDQFIELEPKKGYQMKIRKPREIITYFTNYEAPDFIKKKIKSYNTLISVSSTQQFAKELEQVKRLITRHLDDHRTEGLLNQYSSFVEQFLYFKSIRDDDWREQSSQSLQKCLKQNTQPQPNHQQPFIKIWKQIFNKLPKLMEQKLANIKQKHQKGLAGKCKQILLQGLNKIHLISNNRTRFYGVTLEGGIMINTNQRKDLSPEQFKQGPLKPYIYLCTIHQLTHYIIRKFEECKVSPIESSFSQTDKYGCSIMKDISSSYISKKEYFTLKRKQTISLKEIKNKCQKLQQNLQAIKISFQNFIRQKHRISEDLMQIKEIFLLSQKIVQPMEVMVLDKVQWSIQQCLSIYQYLDKLFQSNKNICQGGQTQYQHRYRFFFSIFCTENIALKLFQPLTNNLQRYYQYRQKLMNYKGNQYFISSNEAIESIIFHIFQRKDLKVCFQLNLHQKYNNYIILRKMKDEDFYNRIKYYNQQIINEISYNQMRQCYKMWNLCASKNIFDSFNENQFIQLKKKEQISYFRQQFPSSVKWLSKDEGLRKQVGTILQYQFYFSVLQEFFKNYETCIAVYQLPYFFMLTTMNDFQSGKLMQKNLFPSLKQYVYRKDYQFLHHISNPEARKQVGVEPKQQKEKRLYCYISHRQNSANHSRVEIGQRQCGTWWLTRKHDEDENEAKVNPNTRSGGDIREFEQMNIRHQGSYIPRQKQ